MAYLALYRKWRPGTFTDVVGQKHISIPIMRAIEQDRLAHAYLFSGPRGTGKTSMAKILAKSVNCLSPDGVNPCNHCRSCEEINKGSSLDVYEIDAASNRGIEEIRALRDSVRTLPAAVKKKVYIIDEVHMLTKEAFNALLKTLEEPPSHVLFILATTEPEKIPLTILSRCQRYEFHRISVEDIKNHLLHIAKESHLSLTEDAANLIAVRADGGLRDALSLLDQCSSVSAAETLDAKTVYSLLGLTGKDQIIDLSHHIFNGKSADALSLFYAILQNGIEPAAVLHDLLEHFRNLMICKVTPDAPELIQYGDKLEVLRSDASRLSSAYMDTLFDYLHTSLSEIKRSSFPRLSAEMGILHLCRARNAKSLDALTERVNALELEIDRLKKGIPASADGGNTFTAPVMPAAPSVPKLSPMPTPAPLPAPEVPIPVPVPPVSSPKEKPTVPAPQPMAPREKPVPEKTPGPLPSRAPSPMPNEPAPSMQSAPAGGAKLIDPASYNDIWQKVLNYFRSIHRIDVFTCFKKCVMVYCSTTRAVVSAPEQFLVLAGNNKSYQKVAAEAFTKVVGYPVEIHTVKAGGPEEAEAVAMIQAAKENGTLAGNSPAPSPESRDRAKTDYRLVSKDGIPERDHNDPALNEALKIMADCDIYEKTDS